ENDGTIGKTVGFIDDPHRATAHRVAADASFAFNRSSTCKTKGRSEMFFFRRTRRKKFLTRFNFENAFAAFPLFDTRGGNLHTDLLSTFEQRRAGNDGRVLMIDKQLAHWARASFLAATRRLKSSTALAASAA